MKLLSVEHTSAHSVAIDSNGGLVWSVLLLYPEYGQSDIIQAFREEDRCVTLWHIRVGVYIRVAV